MRHALIGTLMALVLAAPATAATPTPRQLQRQIAAVNVRVSALGGRVNAVQSELDQTQAVLANVMDVETCRGAIHWDAIRILAIYVGIGDIGRVDDGGACARVGVNRPHALRMQARDVPELGDIRAQLASLQYHHRG
jgi:hypothetical protein